MSVKVTVIVETKGPGDQIRLTLDAPSSSNDNPRFYTSYVEGELADHAARVRDCFTAMYGEQWARS